MDCSYELFEVKMEPEDDSSPNNSSDNSKKGPKIFWTTEKTLKLIHAWEKDCRELWDGKHPQHRDRVMRSVRQEYLADVCETTTEEVCRKLHNLRSQFNQELRKIKKRRLANGDSSAEHSSIFGGSVWEYFDALTFLCPETFHGIDHLEQIDSVNIALAEFQANEEEEFGEAARRHQNAIKCINQAPSPKRERGERSTPRVAASGPPMLPPHPIEWAEEPLPKIRPGMHSDECQIFGDFVASELRTLRSDESRKRLKRLIQKAILQVGEEEDDSVNE